MNLSIHHHLDLLLQHWVGVVFSNMPSWLQWRIQDFREGGANSQSECPYVLFCKFFAENCMKMKDFGPGGTSLVPPLDLPMDYMADYFSWLFGDVYSMEMYGKGMLSSLLSFQWMLCKNQHFLRTFTSQILNRKF